jgi:phosphohistidine phosphatase
MKKLLVLRHAKSSWTDPDLADFDRPLNERGLRAAPFMGSVIVKDGLEPELIISSPAERARTTAELVVQGGDLAADVRFEERIYEASPHTLLQIVSDLDDDLETVLLVGHNPGIEDFVKLLTGVYEPMSTAAMAVIELGIDYWEDVAAGTGKLLEVVRPKDRLKTIGKLS